MSIICYKWGNYRGHKAHLFTKDGDSLCGTAHCEAGMLNTETKRQRCKYCVKEARKRGWCA